MIHEKNGEINLSDASLNSSASTSGKSSALTALVAAAALATGTLPSKAALYQDGYSDAAAQGLALQYSPSVGRLSLSVQQTPYSVSGVFLNDNWFLTSAHSIINPFGTGDASITGIYQGATAGSSLTPVLQSFIYPSYNGTGNAPDLALLYIGSGISAPSLTLGTVSAGEIVTSVGFGTYGSIAGGLTAPDGNARGWQAPVLSFTAGGYSSTYYQSAEFNPSTGLLMNGKGINGDSGSPVFNGSGQLVGLNAASGGGMSPFGHTEFLNFNQPEIQSWMNTTIQSVPEPSTFGLLGIGAAALYFFGRKKKD